MSTLPSPSPTPLLIELIGSDTATFWWTPLLPVIYTLAGAVIGAGATIVTNWLTDRRKAAREDEQRWDDELLKRALAVISTLEALYKTNSEVQVLLNAVLTSMDANDVAAAKAAQEVNTSALNAFSLARTELMLIAPAPVVSASTVLATNFSKVQIKMEVVADVPPPFLNDMAQADFINAVRAAAGVRDFTKRTAK